MCIYFACCGSAHAAVTRAHGEPVSHRRAATPNSSAGFKSQVDFCGFKTEAAFFLVIAELWKRAAGEEFNLGEEERQQHYLKVGEVLPLSQFITVVMLVVCVAAACRRSFSFYSDVCLFRSQLWTHSVLWFFISPQLLIRSNNWFGHQRVRGALTFDLRSLDSKQNMPL